LSPVLGRWNIIPINPNLFVRLCQRLTQLTDKLAKSYLTIAVPCPNQLLRCSNLVNAASFTSNDMLGSFNNGVLSQNCLEHF
jgi:hypothetical protein